MTNIERSPSQHLCSPTQNKSKLKIQIDQMLFNDYSILNQEQQHIELSSLQSHHNNPLILEYVKNIYDQYSIADPLRRRKGQKKDVLMQTPTQIKSTKKKYIRLMSAESNKYQTPKKIYEQPQTAQLKAKYQTMTLQDSLQQKYQLKRSDVVESEVTIQKKDNNNTTLRASNSYFDSKAYSQTEQWDDSRVGMKDKYQSGHRQTNTWSNMQVIIQSEIKQNQEIYQTDNKPQQLPPSFGPSPHNEIVEQQKNIIKIIQNPLPLIQTKFKQLKVHSIGKKQEKKTVQVSFRYCVGCEQALLHINIEAHQKVCKLFQQVFEMEPAQIVQFIRNKIHSIQQRIRQHSKQLMKQESTDLRESSLRLIKQSEQIVNSGELTPQYEREYSRVVDIGRKWCLITEDINKVNWFLKIRQSLKRQFQL